MSSRDEGATGVPAPAARFSEPRVPEVGVVALHAFPWGDRWQTRQHLLVRLARWYRVLSLNPALEWRAAVRGRRPERLPTGPIPPGLEVADPPRALPVVYRSQRLADALLRARLAWARRRLARRDCRVFVAYLWRPHFEAALGARGYRASCYHVEDEYSFSSVEQPLDAQEERVLRGADQVFLASPALFERKSGCNPHSEHLPNGVDFAAFASPQPEPPDLAGIPRPRVGYAGYLKRQLDWELLLELARKHPEWSFVFAGARAPHPELDAPLARLAALPNAHLLGAKSTVELAAYPQHFDVCMMPYALDDYTRYIYPLKVHEYLAAGRPVVGTPIRSLRELDGEVRLAAEPERFAQEVARSLAPEAMARERVEARRALARRHDWDTLALVVARRLAERLGPPWPERLAAAVALSASGS